MATRSRKPVHLDSWFSRSHPTVLPLTHFESIEAAPAVIAPSIVAVGVGLVSLAEALFEPFLLVRVILQVSPQAPLRAEQGGDGETLTALISWLVELIQGDWLHLLLDGNHIIVHGSLLLIDRHIATNHTPPIPDAF